MRFLNEGLALTSDVYKHPDRKLFYINFDKVGNRVPGFFYIFLVLGWVLLIAKKGSVLFEEAQRCGADHEKHGDGDHELDEREAASGRASV